MIDMKTLNAMSSTELRSLNAQIAKIMKVRSVQAAQSFQAGQKVKFFCSRFGKDVTGTVTKVKIKMVSVNCGLDGNWNVSGSLLRPM